MTNLADHLRRLLAHRGMTIEELASAAQVDARTIRSVLLGRSPRPHARTLGRLAAGLEVDVDEFFRNLSLEPQAEFDRQTNPLVDEVIDEHPRLFADWTQGDLKELYSHFGDGGSLTKEGALARAEVINRKREVLQKIAVLLESGEAEVLIGMVDLLYRRIEVEA